MNNLENEEHPFAGDATALSSKNVHPVSQGVGYGEKSVKIN